VYIFIEKYIQMLIPVSGFYRLKIDTHVHFFITFVSCVCLPIVYMYAPAILSR